MNPLNTLYVWEWETWWTFLPGLSLSVKLYLPFGEIYVEVPDIKLSHVVHKMPCLGLCFNIPIHGPETGSSSRFCLWSNIHLES